MIEANDEGDPVGKCDGRLAGNRGPELAMDIGLRQMRFENLGLMGPARINGIGACFGEQLGEFETIG